MDGLLFLAHRIPYPPNKGDKIRSYHLLRHLAATYRVYLGAFVDEAGDWQHSHALREICADSCLVPLSPARARIRSMRGLLSGQPLTLPYYRSELLAQWVQAVLARKDIRTIFVFSSAMAQYVPAAQGEARRVIDFVDVDSDKWRQFGERQNGPMGWLYRREARRLLAFERAQARRFDTSIFVSAAEAELFCRLAPDAAARVTHIENGVDTERFAPGHEYTSPYAPGERVLVFTGAMDYWPNVQAVDWFATEVFPVVRAQFPEARFYIVGARPARAVRRLGDLPGVVVTGTVADTRPYIGGADVAVAPLRIARGIQNKVLEAMAMGTPVVASPLALQGIAATGQDGVRTGDSPEQFAAAVIALLRNPEQRRACAAAARDFVVRHHRWEDRLARLRAILDG